MPFLGFKSSDAIFVDFSQALGHRRFSLAKLFPLVCHLLQHIGWLGVLSVISAPQRSFLGSCLYYLSFFFLALLQYNLYSEFTYFKCIVYEFWLIIYSLVTTTTVKNIFLTLEKPPWPQLLFRACVFQYSGITQYSVSLSVLVTQSHFPEKHLCFHPTSQTRSN